MPNDRMHITVRTAQPRAETLRLNTYCDCLVTNDVADPLSNAHQTRANEGLKAGSGEALKAELNIQDMVWH
jgi:hypothetical protein